jgi:integrase
MQMARKKIPGITRLPSGRYRARSRRKGYPIDSKVFDSLADAAEWKSAADTKKRHGIYRDTKEAENTTLGDALREYLVHVVEAKKSKTKVNERNHIRQILTDRISDYSLAALNIQHLRDYKLRRLSTENIRKPGCKISSETVRKDLLKISSVFNWYREENGLDALINPMANRSKFLPAKGEERERRLNVAANEEARLLQAARAYGGGEYEFLIRWLLASAMRLQEALLMEWQRVNIETLTVDIPVAENKTRIFRRVPISPSGVAVLREMNVGAVRRISGRIFDINPASVETGWKRIKASAGITDLHLHDLRHEALSRLGDLGLSSSELKKFSGHKHSSSLDRYVHLDELLLAQKLQRLSVA